MRTLILALFAAVFTVLCLAFFMVGLVDVIGPGEDDPYNPQESADVLNIFIRLDNTNHAPRKCVSEYKQRYQGHDDFIPISVGEVERWFSQGVGACVINPYLIPAKKQFELWEVVRTPYRLSIPIAMVNSLIRAADNGNEGMTCQERFEKVALTCPGQFMSSMTNN